MKPLKKIVLNQVDILDEAAMKNLFGGSAGYTVVECKLNLYGDGCESYGKCEKGKKVIDGEEYIAFGQCTFTTTGSPGTASCDCK